MAYPFQPPPENAYQIAGRALVEGGGVFGSMSDMIEKRKQTLIAQRMAEIKAQQEEEDREMRKELQAQTIASSKAEMESKAKALENKQKFQKAIIEGRQVPTGNQIPAPMQTGQSMDPNLLNQGQSQEMDMIPEMRREDYSKEDLIKLALENDQLTPKDYLEQTRDRTKQLRPTYKQGKDGYIYVWDDGTQSWDRTNLEGMPPQSSMPSYMPIVTTDATGQPTTAFVNQKDPNKVVRPDLPKPKTNPKQAEAVRGRVGLLRTARRQMNELKEAWKGIQGTLSAGFGQGKTPTEAGMRFDSAVDNLRLTQRALTRTPGEGSMSDFESKLSQLPLPNRNKFEKRIGYDIQNLDDLITGLESGYTGLASEYQVENQPQQNPKAENLRSKYEY